MTNRASLIVFSATLLLCAAFAHSQVSVAIAPNPHPQFLDGTGKPLASGFLYTYQAGTTTLLNTYADSGGIVQNPDPIPLDATGAPSNGSTQTGIWLANTAYKFCAYNSALVQQWCTDNVTGYLGLLNLANLWTFQQTFSLPIVDTAIDNQIVLGSPGNQTTLDFPPPTGNVTQHGQNTSDTFVYRNTTDTLANKTFTVPLFNSSGCGIVNGPGTYICIANASSTGTTINTLTKIINAPSQAVIAAITDTTGILGLCVSLCGTTLTATIQQSGTALCVFDGATTANDYVQSSSTVAGNCHDAGSTYPASGQLVGKVLSTNGSGGTFSVVLIPPEICGVLCGNNSLQTPNGITANFSLSAGSPAPSNSIGNSIILNGSNATSPGIHAGGNVIVSPGTGVGGGANGVLAVNHGVNGPGMQHRRGASCVTGAGAASTCDTTLTWPFNFDDTSYTASCTIDTPTAVPYVLSTKTKTVTQITVTIANLTAVAASGTLNCIGMHD